MFTYNIVCAHSWPEYGIGQSKSIPWNLKGDLANFKRLTISPDPAEAGLNIVVMGRATYDSLPKSVKPLPGRFNVIITNNEALLANNHLNPDAVFYTSWDKLEVSLADLAATHKFTGQVYIIGGAEIYKLALDTLAINTAFITEVYQTDKKDMTRYDKFFPAYDMLDWVAGPNKFNLIEVSSFISEKDIQYRYLTFKTRMPPGLDCRWKSPEADQYLAIMKQIMERGVERGDRTQTGTLSLFGTMQRYDLRDTFPLCTTKRMFFRAIYEELALYLSGRTDNKILQDAGIHIWDGNTSREFLDKRGLGHYPEGDMGETYGFNFRHYGAKYEDCKKELPLDGSVGYDQVANIIHLLKTDPTSRRIIINLWNPATQHNAALPSCLMMYQFYVNTQVNTLSCQIYIRSSDYFLANNWNTCTGALLVHMLCGLEGINLTPGELIVMTGDTHIYKTHLEQVNQNLERQPYPFPALVISGAEKRKAITDYKFADFRLIGYKAHPNIPAPMAV